MQQQNINQQMDLVILRAQTDNIYFNQLAIFAQIVIRHVNNVLLVLPQIAKLAITLKIDN